MNYSSSSAAGGVLCQSQRSGHTNGEAGKDDEKFLEDRAANQGRHLLTLLAGCADRADSLLTSVIAEPPNFYFLARATERSITAARELLRKPQPSRKKAIPARALRAARSERSLLQNPHSTSLRFPFACLANKRRKVVIRLIATANSRRTTTPKEWREEKAEQAPEHSVRKPLIRYGQFPRGTLGTRRVCPKNDSWYC